VRVELTDRTVPPHERFHVARAISPLELEHSNVPYYALLATMDGLLRVYRAGHFAGGGIRDGVPGLTITRTL
jgi:hypothetical protein